MLVFLGIFYRIYNRLLWPDPRPPLQNQVDKTKNSFIIDFKIFSTAKEYGDIVLKLESRILEHKDFCFAYSNKLILIPHKGTAFRYPLDSYQFDIPIFIGPKIEFDVIEIINRTDLLIAKKPEISFLNASSLLALLKEHQKRKSNYANPNIQIKFKLIRKPSLILAFIAITLSIVVFIYLTIFRITNIDSLLTAIAGFFFSVWSARNIVVQNIDIFPTLLDIVIFYSSFVFLASVITKLIFGYYKKKGHN